MTARPIRTDSRRDRSFATRSGRATGIVEGGMGAVRAIAAKMPRVPDSELEASTLAMIKDMNRAGLTAFGVAGCDPNLRARCTASGRRSIS